MQNLILNGNKKKRNSEIHLSDTSEMTDCFLLSSQQSRTCLKLWGWGKREKDGEKLRSSIFLIPHPLRQPQQEQLYNMLPSFPLA